MASDPRIGTTIAGYRIEAVLGRGGMGVVYLAEQLALSRKVALKVLAPELAEDPKFRDRFLRESRIAASLEDPNILPVYEAGEADGALFIAMRYVRGTDLRRLIDAEGPLAPERTVSILTQAASALDAAHAEGLIHRDVKPANVLLVPGSPDRVYLADFGLTKRAASDSGVTGTGQFLGSVEYAAPEQFEGRPVDRRTDVYALGCVLYECLIGEPPYRRESEAAVMYAHLRDDPPRPRTARPEVPAAFDPVVARAMAKRPEARYPTAGDLAQEARKALPTAAPSPAGRPSRRALLAAAAAAVVAAGIVVALVLLARHGTTAAPPRAGPSTSLSPSSSPTGLVSISNGIAAFDPKTGRVTKTVPGEFGHGAFAAANFLVAGEAGVWTSDSNANLVRIDPRTGRRQTIPLGHVQNPVDGVTIGDGSVWVLRPSGGVGYVFRIDPATLRVLQTYRFQSGIGEQTGFGVAFGSAWMSFANGQVDRIDIASGKVTPIKVPSDGLSVGPDGVWVVDGLHDTIRQIDPAGKLGPVVTVQGGLDGIVDEAGSLWVLQESSGQVVQIDPRNRTIVGTPIRVGSDPTAISAGLGAVWVTDRNGDLWRIDPTTASATPAHLGGVLASAAPDDTNKVVWVLVGGTLR